MAQDKGNGKGKETVDDLLMQDSFKALATALQKAVCEGNVTSIVAVVEEAEAPDKFDTRLNIHSAGKVHRSLSHFVGLLEAAKLQVYTNSANYDDDDEEEEDGS